MAVPTEMVQLQNWGDSFFFVSAIFAAVIFHWYSHTGDFAAILDSSRWDYKCKIVYLFVKGAKSYIKLLYHGATKFTIPIWRKAPQIGEQKTGYIFFTKKVHIPVKTPPFTTT